MSLTIVADGAAHDLNSLAALLDAPSTPNLIEVNNGAKFITFRLGNNGKYIFSRVQVGPMPVKKNALSAIDNVIEKIKSEFGLTGGRYSLKNSRRRRSRRSRNRRTRR